MFVTVSTSLAGRRLAVLTVLLGGFTAFGPLSMDLYLPAFPQLAADLGASQAAVQLTLTADVIGLVLGQLVLGATALAAIVAVMLIKGGWILATVQSQYMMWTVLLFGFLAGFSEFFVPNALKQVEAAAPAKAPAAK